MGLPHSLSKKELETLVQFGQKGYGLSQIEALVEVLRNTLERHFGFADFSLVLFNEDDSQWKDFAVRDGVLHSIFSQSLLGNPSNFGLPTDVLTKLFVEESGILAEEDLAQFKDIGSYRYLIPAGCTEFAPIPLGEAIDLRGFLLLRSMKRSAFSESNFPFLLKLANQLAIALNNLLKYEVTQQSHEKCYWERKYLEDEIRSSFNFESIVGHSPAMQQVFEMVEQVADSDSTVIILGETGTGKELIARALHSRSPRHKRPLIKLNCATLPAQLLEFELFGHEKGIRSEAPHRRIGKFELADQGTIFLDEVVGLPMELQAKVLQVLQEQELKRIGGHETLKVDVRIIAATNRNLETEVAEGNFRADLYFRLNVFPIVLPPLRQRTEDIPSLAQHFLERHATKLGKHFAGISEASLRQMVNYEWPGNVRELEHVIERAVLVSKGSVLRTTLSRFKVASKTRKGSEEEVFEIKTLRDNERELIVKTLKFCQGRVRGKGGAAELLDINPSTLESRMRRLGINKEDLDANRN